MEVGGEVEIPTNSRLLPRLEARWLIALLAVAAAFVVMVMWHPWSRGSDAPVVSATGIPYSMGECHTYPEPVGAAGYNHVATSESDPLLVGADVASSVELGDGRHLWVFGDTSRIIGGDVGLVARNSMIMAGPGCRAVVAAQGGGPVIPDRADGVGYWPMSMLVEHANGVSTVRVMSQRVRGGEVNFAFTNLGPAIATFLIPDGEAPYYQGVVDLGPDNPSKTQPTWGAASAADSTGWWYLYATSNPDQPLVFGWGVRVARVRPAMILDRATWRYWTGAAWSTSEKEASEVIAPAGGVSQTFSVFVHAGQWYAVSKLDGDLGSNLAVWPAASPHGPFGKPVTVGLIPNTTDPSVLRYMPLAHPEVIQARPNTVVVSVSRNTEDLALLLKYPLLYRPYFLDIPLPPVPSATRLDLGPPATS